jgi:DNA-binding NtrC family response regulator
VPALRKHKEDIPLLVRNFLRDLNREDFELGPDMLSQLMAHDWPGNVRELRNSIRRACLLAASHRIVAQDLVLPSGGDAGAGDAGGLVREPDRGEIEAALSRHEGVVARAARDLGLSRQSLYRRMEKLGIAASPTDAR